MAFSIRLPATFIPTHATAGLPGYPAIDVFGPPNAYVVSGFWGRVRRISGRPCAQGGTPGGSYGQSVYIFNRVNGWERYATHFNRLDVKVGDRIWPGKVLGTICDSAVSGKPNTSHIHLGLRRYRA